MEETNHTFKCTCGNELVITPFFIGRLYRCSFCKQFGVVPADSEKNAVPPLLVCATERLVLRLAHKKDIPALHAIYSDPRNYNFEISEPSDLRRTKKDLKDTRFPRGFAKYYTLLFVVESKSNEDVLGALRVQFTQPHHSAVVGFMFAQESQGKGFASEALARLGQLLTQNWGLEKLTAMCDSQNLACQAVLEKAGFEREGFLRRFFHHPTRGWLDAPTYALFR